MVEDDRGQRDRMVAKLEGRAKAEANPVNPQRVVWEMSPLLPANAIVTSDSGSCANWYARARRATPPRFMASRYQRDTAIGNLSR